MSRTVQRCPPLPALIHTRSDRHTPLPTHALPGAHVTIQYRHVLHSASLARAPHGPIQATPHERCDSRTPQPTQGVTHARSNPCIPWPMHASPRRTYDRSVSAPASHHLVGPAPFWTHARRAPCTHACSNLRQQRPLYAQPIHAEARARLAPAHIGQRSIGTCFTPPQARRLGPTALPSPAKRAWTTPRQELQPPLAPGSPAALGLWPTTPSSLAAPSGSPSSSLPPPPLPGGSCWSRPVVSGFRPTSLRPASSGPAWTFPSPWEPAHPPTARSTLPDPPEGRASSLADSFEADCDSVWNLLLALPPPPARIPGLSVRQTTLRVPPLPTPTTLPATPPPRSLC